MNMITLNMTATHNNAGAGAGDNSGGILDRLKRDMAMLGKSEAAGQAARPKAGLALVSLTIDSDGYIGEDHAEVAYDAYMGEVAKAAAKSPLVTQTGNASSRKAQVSKFRQFIKVAMLNTDIVDARDVLARAMVQHKSLLASEVKVKSPFDALVDVCRAQLEQADTPLTDEQLGAIVSKAEPAEKDEMAKLVAAYKAAHKLAETIPMAQTLAAVEAYRDAIVEAGGDVPAMTKEEKEQAAFMAKAAKLGFAVSK